MAFVFDIVSARFRSRATGRYVSHSAVRDALDTAIANAAKDARAVTLQLRAGEVTIAEWQQAMAGQIKSSQSAAAALARGGWAQMRPADWLRVARSVKEQYGYLRRYAEQIASGAASPSTRRSEMYVSAARKAYETQRRAEMTARGVRQHRSVRHALDSCEECIELAALGWVSIETTIALPGERTCRSSCRCSISYR